jgi:hypothetical protein
MADEVERLVLAPFREIVQKGKTAIENVESAGDEAPAGMLKAAQNLVKEGEKALKKIEPVSTATYEEYGSNFIDAVKANGAIITIEPLDLLGLYTNTRLQMTSRSFAQRWRTCCGTSTIMLR